MNFSQWRDIAGQTSFPFLEGTVQALDGLVLDARINLPPGSSGAFLKQIISSGTNISVTVCSIEGDEIGRGTSSIGGGVIDLIGPADSNVGMLLLAQDGPPVSGVFTSRQSAFEATCLVPAPFRSVRRIVVSKKSLSGKIALAEGSGIKLVKLADNKLRIDAIGSTEDLERCCPELKEPVLKLNAAEPDKRGNISIEPMPYEEPEQATDLMQILRVSSGTNSLTFYLAK